MRNVANRVSAGLGAAIIAIMTIIAPLVQPHKAYALTENVPYCGNTQMEDWNWPEALRSSTGTAPEWDNFDPDEDSYVIFRRKSMEDAVPKRNVYEIIKSTGGKKIAMMTVSGLAKIGMAGDSSGNGLKEQAFIYSEDRNQALPGYQVNTGTAVDRTASDGTNFTVPMAFDPANVNCYYTAHNVVYADTWTSTFNGMSGVVGYSNAALGTAGCETLDIGCKIKQGFKAVGDTFKAVGEAIVNGLASLFMPDGDYVKDEMDDFGDFLEAKFGFLSYPLVFISNMINSFNDTSNNWCTTSSCTKNFGNFMGAPFVVNVTQIKTSMPTYYNWFVAMMRGLVVLGLILSLRQSLLKVLHK